MTDVTDAVLAAFDDTPNARARQLAQALTRHLHAFAEEVELTEAEWAAGVDFLTRAGQISDSQRQELILLSDVLGLSMLTIQLANPVPPGATEPTVFGPFFVEGSPEIELGGDLAAGAPGEPCYVEGSVRGVDGEAVAGARVEVWQADDDGRYDVQYADLDGLRGRGHLRTDEAGAFRFWTVRPRPYPIPDDGPVGELMAATARSVYRPAHIHFMVTAPGYRRLVTHLFDDTDPYLDRDAVFGVRPSLLVTFEPRGPGRAPDGQELATPFWTVRADLVLGPAS